MPTSSTENKIEVAELLGELIDLWRTKDAVLPPRILDVGAGEGTWARLLAEHAWPPIWMTAVEYYTSYITRYGLNDLYNEVHRMDARDLTGHDMRRHTAVIFGDVLEHMPKVDARTLLASCDAVPLVLVSNPVKHVLFDGPDGHDLDGHRAENLWTASEMFAAMSELLPNHIHFTLVGEVLSYHLALWLGTGISRVARRPAWRMEGEQGNEVVE